MFTRCPECATIFRVTAEQLRMAHGDVRCGNCTKSFNALLSLMDERPAHENDVPVPEQEESFAESNEDLEFNAPEQSWTSFFMTAAPAPAMPPAEPITEEPVDELPEEAVDEPLEEYTGKHEEWRGMLSDLSGDAELDDDGPVYSVGDESGGQEYQDDEPTNEHPIIKLEQETNQIAEEPETTTEPQEEDSQTLWVLENVDGGQPAPEVPTVINDEVDSAAPIRQFSYGDYEDVVLDESTGENTTDPFPPWISEERLDDAFPEPNTKTSPRWYAAGGVLLLILLAQMIHYNRDALAAHPSFGTAIRTTYRAFNVTLFPEWGLDSFEVTGSDAVAGRSAPAALDVLAEVTVKAAEPVGLPLVRVALRDRWSNPVANRVFRPTEYSPGAIETGTVAAPGTTIPVEISVMDPGTDALGYLVDICLPHRTEGLKCQLANDPFKR